MNSIVLRERNGTAVIGNEALARMLVRYGFGQAQQAAIRAFGRIVDGPGLAESLLERLDLLTPEGSGEGAIGPALREFCEELARLPVKSDAEHEGDTPSARVGGAAGGASSWRRAGMAGECHKLPQRCHEWQSWHEWRGTRCSQVLGTREVSVRARAGTRLDTGQGT